jgi:hypothetical protein
METTMTINPVTTLLFGGLNETDEDSYTKKSYSASTVNNHADMIKLQVENFFHELKDLVIIDNIYRGLL